MPLSLSPTGAQCTGAGFLSFFITVFPGPCPEPGPQWLLNIYWFHETWYTRVSCSTVSSWRAGAPFLIFLCLIVPSSASYTLVGSGGKLSESKALEIYRRCIRGLCMCTSICRFYCISSLPWGNSSCLESPRNQIPRRRIVLLVWCSSSCWRGYSGPMSPRIFFIVLFFWFLIGICLKFSLALGKA